MSSQPKNPAENLKGLQLHGGWKVIDLAPKSIRSTGGNFSICYIVQGSDGKRAFLKALDFSKGFKAPDPARALQALTEAFNYERDLLYRCRDRRLSRVVMALDDGSVTVPGNYFGNGLVQYVIFELGDGDARSQADAAKRFDLAWSLRSLHHVAVGLMQLHRQGIAHQDLKPSNVVVFKEVGSKVSDLGRASYRSQEAPSDQLDVVGDPTYAPPEALYSYIDPDWYRRRLGCDTFLMGSMVVFFFLGIGMTTLLSSQLHPAHRWDKWNGTYEDALPYLRDAFGKAIDQFASQIHADLRPRLIKAVEELCDPDPKLRGNPMKRNTIPAQYSMERYVSLFNLLAQKAEFGVIGK